MAWIESHQELARHPKTKRLARDLGVSLRDAIGAIHLLWWWALDYADDGNLERFQPADIADALIWDEDADVLVSALQDAGFLDGMRIHDWDDYAGRLVERRAANAERMRQARLRLAPSINSVRAENVQDTSASRSGATVPNTTVPNTTVPNQTNEDSASADAAPLARGRPRVKAHGENLAPIFDAFAEHELSVGLLRELGTEQKAASSLIRSGVPPGDLADCWGDIRAGQYGDQYARENLSFAFLASHNHIGNWQEWRDSGRPPQERANGRTNGNPWRGSTDRSGPDTDTGIYEAFEERGRQIRAARAAAMDTDGAAGKPAINRVAADSA